MGSYYGLSILCHLSFFFLLLVFQFGRILQPSVRSFVHSIWKAIENGWEVFKVRTHFKVGSRNMVKFWKDRWCGDELLRDAFPNQFSIASSKDARVADAWDGGIWNPRFIR